MKIIPNQLYNYSQTNRDYNYTHKLLNDTPVEQTKPNGLSFKAALETKLLLIAHEVKGKAVTWYKLAGEKKRFSNVLLKPRENSSQLLEVMSSISKTSNNVDSGLIADICTSSKLGSIKDMKDYIMQNIFKLLDDGDEFIRAQKRSFLTNLYDNGDYQTETFVDTFKNLPDVYYKNFKKDFVGNILFVQDKADKNYDKFYYKHELAKSIDNGNYQDYSEDFKRGYKRLTDQILLNAKKLITDRKNLAYKCYLEDGNVTSYDILKYGFWKPYNLQVIDSIVNTANITPQIIAKNLKIDLFLAQDLKKDYDTLKLAKSTSNKDQSLEILRKRIKEKLATDYFGESNYSASSTSSKLRDALYLKYKNILKFIERSNEKEGLAKEFKKEIEEIKNRYSNIEENVRIDRESYSGMDTRV